MLEKKLWLPLPDKSLDFSQKLKELKVKLNNNNLSADDAWHLFRDLAFESTQENELELLEFGTSYILPMLEQKYVTVVFITVSM